MVSPNQVDDHMNINLDLSDDIFYTEDTLSDFKGDINLVTFNFVDCKNNTSKELEFKLPNDAKYLGIDLSGRACLYKHMPEKFTNKKTNVEISWDIVDFSHDFADVFKIEDVEITDLILVDLTENADYFTIHLN